MYNNTQREYVVDMIQRYCRQKYNIEPYIRPYNEYNSDIIIVENGESSVIMRVNYSMSNIRKSLDGLYYNNQTVTVRNQFERFVYADGTQRIIKTEENNMSRFMENKRRLMRELNRSDVIDVTSLGNRVSVRIHNGNEIVLVDGDGDLVYDNLTNVLGANCVNKLKFIHSGYSSYLRLDKLNNDSFDAIHNAVNEQYVQHETRKKQEEQEEVKEMENRAIVVPQTNATAEQLSMIVEYATKIHEQFDMTFIDVHYEQETNTLAFER